MGTDKARISDRVADVLAALFVVFILLFAAQGPLQELVRTIIPALTPEWEELSKRAKRVALKEGLIGGTFQFLKVNFFTKTAVFLGVPLLASLVIVALSMRNSAGRASEALRWTLAVLSLVLLGFWFVQVYTRDMSQVIEPERWDMLLFPVAILLVLYFTLREYGGSSSPLRSSGSFICSSKGICPTGSLFSVKAQPAIPLPRITRLPCSLFGWIPAVSSVNRYKSFPATFWYSSSLARC